MNTWHIATCFNTADGTPSDTRVEAASFRADGDCVTFANADGETVLVMPKSALLYAKRLA